MTYDCFSFFNELDLLEIRLNTLDKVVDRFVLVEAPWTHTGRPKPLYYEENKERFSKFADRITHIVADDPPVRDSASNRENAWIRENWQRNQISRGLADAKPEDILIISDLDEIPAPEAVKEAKAYVERELLVCLQLRYYSFYLNMRNASRPFWLNGPKILTMVKFRNSGASAQNVFSEACVAELNGGTTATKIRFLQADKTVPSTGWHFTWAGGMPRILEKAKSVAESELCPKITEESIRRNLMRGRRYQNGVERFVAEVVDETFPEYIRVTGGRFSEMILPCIHNSPKWLLAFYRLEIRLHDMLFAFIIKCTPRFLVPLRAKLFVKFRNMIQKF